MEKNKIIYFITIIMLTSLVYAIHASWHAETFADLPDTYTANTVDEFNTIASHMVQLYIDYLDSINNNAIYRISTGIALGDTGESELGFTAIGKITAADYGNYMEIISIQKRIEVLEDDTFSTYEKFKTTNAEYNYLLNALNKIDTELNNLDEKFAQLLGCNAEKADSNCDEHIALQDELIPYIDKWVSGSEEAPVTIGDLTLAIESWITQPTEKPFEKATDAKDVSLIAKYTFDEDTDTDYSLDEAAIVKSDVKWNATQFDGIDDKVTINGNDKLNFGTGAFTLMAWIKMNENSEGARHIIGKRGEGNNWYRIYSFNGDLRFEVSGGANIRTQTELIQDDRVYEEPLGFYNDDAWYLVTATRDADGTALLYVDGERKAEGILDGDVLNTAAFTIGKWGSEKSFNGEIDEVRVWNRVLNETEIYEIYGNEAP